jgi:hypothetical protein
MANVKREREVRRGSQDGDLSIGQIGISKRVKGRSRRPDGRVTYRVDGRDKIPEEVVLYRWRKVAPTPSGATRHGHRLPPRIWALLGAIAGELPRSWKSVTRSDLVRAVEVSERKGVELPGGERPYAAMEDVLRILPRRKLRKLFERHTVARDPLGVPDLMLFWRTGGGRLRGEMFVEVKKPRESVSAAQREEILFLRQELGLQAGVLRLQERVAAE